MLVDSGSSFSYLPERIFKNVADEVILFLPFSYSFNLPGICCKSSKFVFDSLFRP